MQMRKINREKGYSGQNGYDNILSIYIFLLIILGDPRADGGGGKGIVFINTIFFVWLYLFSSWSLVDTGKAIIYAVRQNGNGVT